MISSDLQNRALSDYVPSVTGRKFHTSSAFVKGVMGPIGSGKSHMCCLDLYTRASYVAPCSDGVARSRALIVRNTSPQLETTVMKTWSDLFPPRLFGKISGRPPYTHGIRVKTPKGEPDIELEVIFMALDKADDVSKLLSFECNFIFFNEARDILFEIISAATGRVSRYPRPSHKPTNYKGAWPSDCGIIMDTNPPDVDHWWYRTAEENFWAYKSPGVLRDELVKAGYNRIEDIPPRDSWKFFRQPSGLSPEAENLENLRGGVSYYHRICMGKDPEWINVYVHGDYGSAKEGRPVYGDSFKESVHVMDVTFTENVPVIVGVDCGLTRNPAAVIAQKAPFGAWNILDEFELPEEGEYTFKDFCKELQLLLKSRYPSPKVTCYLDPAAVAMDPGGISAMNVMQSFGFSVQLSPTQVTNYRIDAVLSVLNRMAEGAPAFRLSKNCQKLKRGFNGGYHYRRMRVSGVRYTNDPEKNKYSHVHDALQYLLCGGGEYRDLRPSSSQNTVNKFSMDWRIYGR